MSHHNVSLLVDINNDDATVVIERWASSLGYETVSI